MDPARTDGPGDDPLIVCELVDGETSAQVERWTRLLRDAGLEHVETEDGLRIRFRDEPAVDEELRSLVSVESKCCSWARWEVHRAGGDLVLKASSTSAGAVTLRSMFGVGPT